MIKTSASISNSKEIPVSSLRGLSNLRRDPDEPSDCWRAAALPIKVADMSARPICTFRPQGVASDVTLFVSGESLLCALRGDWPDGSVQQIGTLAGTPIGAFTSSPGYVALVMRHAPTVYVAYDLQGRFTLLGPMPALPPVALAVADEATISEPIAPLTLSGTSPRTGSLNDADTAALTSAVVAAYRRLCASAKARRLFPQPVLARWRAVDAQGTTLAVSPVTMLCHSAGFQGVGTFAMTSADSLATLQGGALTLGVYRPRLVVGGSLPRPWCGIAAKVVVEVSDPLDFVDVSALCPNRVSDQGTHFVVSYRLPGCQTMEAELADLQRLVVDALGRAESLLKPLRAVSLPFAEGGEIRLDLSELSQQEGGTVKLSPQSPATYSAMGRFGGYTFMANPLVEGATAPQPFALAVKMEADTSWRAGAWAQWTDSGELTASASQEADGYAPVRLSPLLCVASEDARQLGVTVETPSGVVRQIFPLQPLVGTGTAYYLNPLLAPISLTASSDGFSVPASTTLPWETPGRVDVFSDDNLAAPCGSLTVPGVVTALAEAPRAQASWDFARLKLVVMGTQGIYIAKIEKNGSVGSFALLDPRGVESDRAVCTASGASGGVLAAIAGGDLVEISSRKVATLWPNTGASRLGFCQRYAEYWLNHPLRRFTAAGEMIEVRFAELPPDTEFFTHGGGLMLSVPGSAEQEAALRCAEREEFPAEGVATAAQWHFHAANLRPLQPRWLTARVFGASLVASLELAGHNGSAIPALLARFSLTGDLDAPFLAGLRVPSRRFLTLSVSANGCKGDFSLRNPSLTL